MANNNNQTSSSITMIVFVTNCLFIMLITNQLAVVDCFSYNSQNQHSRSSMFVARRSAEDSRPLSRVNINSYPQQIVPAASELNQETAQVVMGKFRAPSPDRIYKARVPKQSNIGSQTVSASFRVSDVDSTQPEKIVHGIIGQQQQQQQRNDKQHVVSAKIQVSDEGLNYPPSKLSADIYGNVAEIVTAPPEAVDNDFLIPANNQMFGARRSASAGN